MKFLTCQFQKEWIDPAFGNLTKLNIVWSIDINNVTFNKQFDF